MGIWAPYLKGALLPIEMRKFGAIYLRSPKRRGKIHLLLPGTTLTRQMFLTAGKDSPALAEKLGGLFLLTK